MVAVGVGEENRIDGRWRFFKCVNSFYVWEYSEIEHNTVTLVLDKNLISTNLADAAVER